jgi:predicted flap endonuclease-1-like 5' DNA nuclease
MVEKTNTPADFVAQMLDVQRQYMNNLGQLFQTGQQAAGDSPFETWWKQFPSTGQGGFDDFFQNLARASLSIVQNPAGDLSSLLQSGKVPPDWFEAMQGQFSEWLKAGASNPVFEQMNERLRQQLLKPFGLDLGAPGFDPAALMDSSIVKLLQGLYNSEEKQAGEQLLKTLEAYQQQIMAMNHMLAQVGIDGIKSLQSQFEGAADTDVKALYQNWMEISQKIFNELKLDERYRELHDNLRKIEKQLKLDIDMYRQSLIEQIGMVAREEFDALKKELDDLKNEIRGMASKQAAAATPKAEPQPEAKAEPEPEPETKAAPKSEPRPDTDAGQPRDDFTVLNGIGKKFNEKLHEQGVISLQQLAAMSDDMLKSLDENLQTNGRMFQQQWREQAEQVVNSLKTKKQAKE